MAALDAHYEAIRDTHLRELFASIQDAGSG